MTFLLCPPPALACHACFLRLSRVCGRSLKEECFPLFVLFVLFGQAKSTLCFMYFCVTKSTKSHLRRSLLEISLPFPALPKCEQYIPSCANISSEPSDHRQRQKCRFQCTGCLLDFALCHADTAGVPALPKRARRLGSVSVQTSYTPATPFMRKEFKRGIPSSFCPFRTFRTSEKYLTSYCTLLRFWSLKYDKI